MFRRFMIVCWVVLSLAALVGLVGWAGYSHFERKAEAIVRVAQAESEQRFKDAGDVLWGNKDTVVSTAESRIEQGKGVPFMFAGVLGGILAGVLLIWNIIWHTGHWIWMGRESGVEAKP